MTNSTISIDLQDFDHLKHMSCYNHNFYQHKIGGTVILQIGNDDGWTDYYIIPNPTKPNVRVFLFGCDITCEVGTVSSGYLFMEYF